MTPAHLHLSGAVAASPGLGLYPAPSGSAGQDRREPSSHDLDPGNEQTWDSSLVFEKMEDAISCADEDSD
jgi:hypothetical protein